MKIVSVVGARPQFIKAFPVSREIRKGNDIREILVHTGQHYDYEMSRLFFEELNIPEPDVHLEAGSGRQGEQTARILERLEVVLIREAPDLVLVYGDTNSTLAAALAAAKLHIPIAHVEAGLRSFNKRMPEEINRVLTDHLASLLFCPSQTAMDNLAKEGITRGVLIVGDVMAEALDYAANKSRECSKIISKLQLEEKNYLLATVHRAENTDDDNRLTQILEGFLQTGELIVLPLHPRTRRALKLLDHPRIDMDLVESTTEDPSDQRYSKKHSQKTNSKSLEGKFCIARQENILFIPPVGYLDMVRLQQSARLILTDSGGLQKEAYWLGVPCLTLREESEWIETIETGWNVLVGANCDQIVSTVKTYISPHTHPLLYGDRHASTRCVQSIVRLLSSFSD